MNNCKVSIIVPVYNVEDYIDDCIESIVKQTFQNIEILLIIGQSSDNSNAKCEKWLERDPRIRVIKEREPGLGPARNQGVEEAKGEYIVFVDSDDMINPFYVEKMYHAIVEAGADLVECNYSRIRSYTESLEHVPCTEILRKRFHMNERLLLGNTALWKIMTRKSLWYTNHIRQPFGAAEDFYTYPLLLFCADKIADVSEDLYLYRKDRSGNLCSNMEKISSQFMNAIESLVNECKRRQFLPKYEEILSMYVRRWIFRHSSPCLGKMDHKAYIKMEQKYMEVYERCFPKNALSKEMLLGGFNLNRIINKLPVIEDPYCRYNFVSLVSVVSTRKKTYGVQHKNKYREFMLKREYQGNFFDLLDEQKPNYFFFDLLEERHDILKVGDMFFTKSDAFQEADITFDTTVEVVERDSVECQKLWENSCLSFFERLFRYVAPDHVIMVKSFLMEQYGDGVEKRYFADLEKIRKINRILEKYYDFIEENCPGIQVIEMDRADEYYYTDINYEFGCYPWHMNEWENIKAAEKINL